MWRVGELSIIAIQLCSIKVSHGFWPQVPISQCTQRGLPLVIAPSFVYNSLEVEWNLKIRIHEPQLLLAWVERKLFLFIWAKSNCDSLLLVLSTHSTSKLSLMQEGARTGGVLCCVHGDMGTCVSSYSIGAEEQCEPSETLKCIFLCKRLREYKLLALSGCQGKFTQPLIDNFALLST